MAINCCEAALVALVAFRLRCVLVFFLAWVPAPEALVAVVLLVDFLDFAPDFAPDLVVPVVALAVAVAVAVAVAEEAAAGAGALGPAAGAGAGAVPAAGAGAEAPAGAAAAAGGLAVSDGGGVLDISHCVSAGFSAEITQKLLYSFGTGSFLC